MTNPRAALGNRNVFSEVIRLLRPFLAVTIFSTGVGALGGLATAWLLATINEGLHAPEGLALPLLARFAGLCVLSVCGNAIAGVGNSLVGQKIIAALRKDISARVLRAPLAEIERQRSYRLLAVLTGDVDNVSAFTFNFSGYVIATAIALGGFVYLFVLSPVVFAISLAAIALGIAINVYSKRGWQRDYRGVRGAQDELQKQYRAITDGVKELRLNRARRARVHGALLSGAADKIAELKTSAMRRFWIANAIRAAIFFLTIAILLMLRGRFGIEAPMVSGAVLVLLYINGPIDQIVGALPAFGQAQIAFQRIASLAVDFREPDLVLHHASDQEMRAVQSIELRAARYAFQSEAGANSFELGPIDLTIRGGETLFIVGENGSGKTTLIKLLLGLYRPTSGELLFNGAPLPDEQLDDYRQLFSAVFSDYFLFDDLMSTDAALTARANGYLERLEITHKVEIKDGAFTTTDLSTGQKKRLALVHAYLEQRPIMMFDEWAADQDPTFRRIYYTELLPELKAQGKTLIVVSHDDRYYEAADRVIRLENGKIGEDKRLADGSRVAGALMTQPPSSRVARG